MHSSLMNLKEDSASWCIDMHYLGYLVMFIFGMIAGFIITFLLLDNM